MESLEAFETAEEVVDIEEQKREEWMRKRSGKLTCSNFDVLMKDGKKDTFTVAAYTYLRGVLAERLGSFGFEGGSSATTWGVENEHVAVADFQSAFPALEVDYDSKRFVQYSPWIGGSPDGLVGHDAVLEIKCPYSPAAHIQNLLTHMIPDEYFWQCVGHCLITGRSKVYFVSCDPRLPADSPYRLSVVVMEVGETLKDQLRTRLDLAVDWLLLQMDRLKVEVSDAQ